MQHLTILVLVALTRPVREAAGIEASGSRNVGIVLSLHVPSKTTIRPHDKINEKFAHHLSGKRSSSMGAEAKRGIMARD